MAHEGTGTNTTLAFEGLGVRMVDAVEHHSSRLADETLCAAKSGIARQSVFELSANQMQQPKSVRFFMSVISKPPLRGGSVGI